MDLKTALGLHPAEIFSGLAVAPFLGIWVWFLISGMIHGDIDSLEGIGGIFVAGVLQVLAVQPPTPALSPLILLAVISLIIAMPLIRHIQAKKELRSFYVDDVQRAYQSLGVRPENPAVKLRLARSLYMAGTVDIAIAIADEAISQVPRELFSEDAKDLAMWKAVAVPHQRSTVKCLRCGHMNQLSSVFCQGCGAPFLEDYAAGKVRVSENAGKFLGAWLALVSLIILIPAAAMALPKFIAILVIVGLLVVTGYSGFRLMDKE